MVANASGTAIQKTHYYPFGTAFAESTGPDKQPYKYNGKELDDIHGLNLYDYSARYYEGALGRFASVDPLAEKFYSWSPYVYCFNDPVKHTDPDGKVPILAIMGVKGLVGAAVDTLVDVNIDQGVKAIGGDKSVVESVVDATTSILPGKVADGFSTGLKKAIQSDLANKSTAATMSKVQKEGLKNVVKTIEGDAYKTVTNATGIATDKVTNKAIKKDLEIDAEKLNNVNNT